jgi:hypothetical protein
MKRILFSAAGLTLSLSLSAQDCKNYFFLNNSEVVMTVFDRKGKDAGKLVYTIHNAAKSGSSIAANYNSEFFTEKGKSITKSTGKFKCVNGTAYMDAKASINSQSMAAYKDMDIKADEVYIEYPSKLSSGQKLKDVTYSMEVYNKGTLFSTLTIKQNNRKIEAKETITTPAGNWEAWKITYDSEFKATIAGIGIPVSMKVTEWFAPGFGVVKSETFNKNGKSLGSTLITSIKK